MSDHSSKKAELGDLTISDHDRHAEYWAYLRHIETVRFQMAAVVSIVVGGALTALIGAAPWDENGGLDPTLGLAIVIGLELFTASAGFYLIGHKANYTWYHTQLEAMDQVLKDKPEFEVFPWLLAMLVLVQAGLMVTAVEFAGAESLIWIAPAVFMLSFGVGAIFYFISTQRARDAASSE